MSHASSQSDTDFWQFVTCARCHLPFSPEPSAPPPVPFWLTECGHVICNNHLNADQSCPECGAQRIQMVPLQREPEMDAPMSDWFRSLPHAIDAIANAAKFQQDMIGSLVHYYKGKYLQSRQLLDRMKSERTDLQKTIAELKSENEQLRQYAGLTAGEASTAPNSNGKRPRIGDAYINGDSRSYSSPRSVATPLGPNRLTLPADQQPPIFGHRPLHPGGGAESRNFAGYDAPAERPRSSRFIQQYAYAPPQTPRGQGSGLSDLPSGQVRTSQRPNSAMPPPPPPVPQDKNRGFRPAIGALPPSNQQASSSRSRQPPAMTNTFAQSSMQPLPSHGFFSSSSAMQAQQQPQLQSATRHRSSTSTSHGVPSRTSTSQLRSQATSSSRFVPQTPSGSRRFIPPPPLGSRAPSRAGHGTGFSNGNQRTPFVPGV